MHPCLRKSKKSHVAEAEREGEGEEEGNWRMSLVSNQVWPGDQMRGLDFIPSVMKNHSSDLWVKNISKGALWILWEEWIFGVHGGDKEIGIYKIKPVKTQCILRVNPEVCWRWEWRISWNQEWFLCQWTWLLSNTCLRSFIMLSQDLSILGSQLLIQQRY